MTEVDWQATTRRDSEAELRSSATSRHACRRTQGPVRLCVRPIRQADDDRHCSSTTVFAAHRRGRHPPMRSCGLHSRTARWRTARWRDVRVAPTGVVNRLSCVSLLDQMSAQARHRARLWPTSCRLPAPPISLLEGELDRVSRENQDIAIELPR